MRTRAWSGVLLRSLRRQELSRAGASKVLIEGGGIILGHAFREQLVDEVHWYIAPLLCGGGQPSLAGTALPASVELDHAKVMPIGDNVHISGYPKWPAK